MGNKYSISKTVIINARPEFIFKILADVVTWNLWTKSVKSIRLLNKNSFDKGTKVRVVQPKLLPITWEVTEIEKDKSFTWVSNPIGLKMTAKHIIEQKSDATLVELITIYEGALAGLIYIMTAGLTNKYMTMEINGLKEESEKSDKQ
jgi:uncharacterized membrane protein